MDIKTKLFYFLIFLIICLGIYLVWFTQSQGYKCMVDATAYAQSLVRGNGQVNFNLSNLTIIE